MKWIMPLLVIAVSAGPALAQRQSPTLDSLETRARIDSSDAEAHYDLGVQYWLAERYDDAERAFRRAVSIEPRHASGHLALGYVPYLRHKKLWKQRQKGEVPSEFAATVTEASRSHRLAYMINPFVGLGELDYIFVGPWLRVELSEKERERMSPMFFLYRGMTLAQLREWLPALSDLHEVLERLETARSEQSADAYLPLAAAEVKYVIAVIEDRAGRSADAVRRLQEVLLEDVGLFMAHSRLAEIHEAKGRTRPAITERRRALALNPGDPSLVYELGVTLARAGLLHEADTVLTRASELNPRNPRIPRMTGLVRHQLGDAARARAAYERFLAIAPSRFQREITEVTEKLQQLDKPSGSQELPSAN